MKTIYKVIISLVVTLAFAVIISGQFDIYNAVSGQKLGSADFPYSYKNISSSNASTTPTIVRGGAGTLGHITINTLDDGAVSIYDSSTIATSVATLIGTIAASTSAQTLTYDVAVVRGIVLELTDDYAGSMTVSYK